MDEDDKLNLIAAISAPTWKSFAAACYNYR